MLWFLFARLNRRSRRDAVRGSVVWAGVWAATVYMLYICFMSCMSPPPHLTPPPSGGPNQSMAQKRQHDIGHRRSCANWSEIIVAHNLKLDC